MGAVACGSPSARCPEADLWRDGGAYKAILHAIIGGLSFGQAGALANLTAELADPVIRWDTDAAPSQRRPPRKGEASG